MPFLKAGQEVPSSLIYCPQIVIQFCRYWKSPIFFRLSEAQDGLRKCEQTQCCCRSHQTHPTCKHCSNCCCYRSGTKTTKINQIVENFCPFTYYSILFAYKAILTQNFGWYIPYILYIVIKVIFWNKNQLLSKR